MTHKFIAAIIGTFIFLVAHATPTCSQSPLTAATEVMVRETLKKMKPMQASDQENGSCEPKVFSIIAYGMPLCNLSPTISAVGVNYLIHEKDKRTISAGYIIEYTPEQHKQLEKLISNNRKKLSGNEIPEKIRKPDITFETNAVYREGPIIISLQKTSDGMPSTPFSFIIFEYENEIENTRRDLNRCN
jgi:hypothetical protein